MSGEQDVSPRWWSPMRLFRRVSSTTCDSSSASQGNPSTSGSSQCPATDADGPMSQCPVVGDDPRNNMPQNANQRPAPGQRFALPTNRTVSTIPKAEFTPEHQKEADGKWVYPSEQMFYNAMKRKGWQPQEDDMRTVVAIHNAVNERTWQEVLAYERLHPHCSAPKLVRFVGRPKDISPKARLMNWMGYKLPFDRHDWIVDRCGQEVRYVIDFYNGSPTAGQPVAMHLDVRPALDSAEALVDRARLQLGWVLSGRWMGEAAPDQPHSDPPKATGAE